MEILLLIGGSFFHARTECSAIWSLLGYAKLEDIWHRGTDIWYEMDDSPERDVKKIFKVFFSVVFKVLNLILLALT
jgi:hypothetical protein